MAELDKVVKGLYETRKYLEDKEWSDNKASPHIDSVIDAISMLKHQWICISDKRPKSNGVYIVARWFSDGIEKKVLTDACYFDGTYEWYDDTRINHSRKYVTDKIVAWMPLPEPPEEVK